MTSTMSSPTQEVRVIGYLRTSTDEQAQDGVSLAVQEAKVRAYCDLYELALVGLEVDPGASGKNMDRPGLQRALGALRQGAADGIVIAKLDRISRSVADMDCLIRGYFGERAKVGAALFSVSDQVDTRTAAGRLVLNVLMSVAQWERETISERTREALQHMKTNGERVGTVAYGWLLGPDGVHLEENPDEQSVIATARGLRAAGLSQRKVVAALAKRGLCNRSGKAFVLTSVQRILKAA